MTGITEAEFAKAVDSRSDKPIYSIMKAAHIGIAGLGGLGSNIAAALVRSGVGHLTLVDFDTVELSNINRQLYTLSHIEQKKATALHMILHEINPFCDITAHTLRITEDNCKALFADCDILIEAFDVPEQKEVTIKFGKGLVGEPFTSKNGHELVEVKIPNADKDDHTPWASFVISPKMIHDNKFGKGVWMKLPEDGTTKDPIKNRCLICGA